MLANTFITGNFISVASFIFKEPESCVL